MRSYLIAAIPVILSLGLLVALRLDEPKQSPALLIGGTESVHRGEDLHAGAGEMKTYEVSGAKIYLAENTTLTLEDSSGETPKLAFREGRILTDGPVDISVRDNVIHLDNQATLIFYSWLDKLDVTALTGNATLTRAGTDELNVPASFSVDTLHTDVPITPIAPFDQDTSSAKDFYDWVLGPSPQSKISRW